MATNGSFNTTPYSNRYLTFAWSTHEVSIEENYTKIYWEVKGAGSQTQWLKSGPFTVVIDGEQVYYSTTRIQLSNGTLVASGFKTIYHNSDGSRNFSASVSAAIYETAVNCSGSGNWDLEPIPRAATITSAPDFSDTAATYTVGIENKAGSAVTVRACISWTGGDDIPYRELTWYEKENGYYTFYFTEEEKNKLLAATTGSAVTRNENDGSASRYVTVYITTCTLNTWNIIGYSTKQVKFTVTDCKPDLESATVIDCGGTSTGLTDTNTKMIRGFNYLHAYFNANLKKSATITSQSISCGNKILSGPGAYEDVNGKYHIFNNEYNNEFVFTITDSRGWIVSKTVTMPAIDYIPLTCNVSYETELYPETNTADIMVTISGNYFNGSFGAKDNNLVLKINSSIGSLDADNWEDITPTFSSGTYIVTKHIKGVNYKDTYVVQAFAQDKINTGVYTKEQVIKIVPVFDWGEDDFNFNVPVTIEGKQVVTYGTDRIARAYTQETNIEYENNSYIKLFRNNSPTDLYNTDIATFNENGLITINKDMTAFVNIHVVSSNPNGRSWIRLMNYESNWQYTDCINYGAYTTSNISIILKFSQGAQIGVLTSEPITVNGSGLIGSYIEIMEL